MVFNAFGKLCVLPVHNINLCGLIALGHMHGTACRFQKLQVASMDQANDDTKA